MGRIAFLLLVCASAAFAYTSTQLLMPGPIGTVSSQIRASQAANELDCITLPAWESVSGATSISVPVSTTVNTAVLGLAIYPDGTPGGDSGSAVCSGTVTLGASNGTYSITCSSFNLTAGTAYRWCTCATSNSVLLSGAQPATAGSTWWDALNAGGTQRAGKGTDCSSGVPGSTSGSLAAVSSTTFWGAPMMVIE